MRVQRLAVALLVVAVVGGGAGLTIAAFDDPPESPPCLPAQPTASPEIVVAGGVVVIESTGFACSFTMSKPWRSSVGFAAPERQLAADVGTVEIDRDGSFRLSVSVPKTTTPGPAYFIIGEGIYDECAERDDSGCPGATVNVVVR